MGRRPEQTFLQRRHTDGQQTCEKVLNTVAYQRNANQNYLIPARMDIIKKSTNNKCWRAYGEKGTLLYRWCECKLLQPLTMVWRFLKKLKTELPYDLGTRVCQGCILSPCLFHLYAEYIMQNKRLDEAHTRIRMPEEITITSHMQMTAPLWQKLKKN